MTKQLRRRIQLIKGIHKILSFTNNVGDGLVLENCGDFNDSIRGYYIVLPRDRFADMCNLLTVVYEQNKEVCFSTFEDGSDEQVVQLCNTLKGRQSFTAMFIEAFGGITNLVSSSLSDLEVPNGGLNNPLSSLGIVTNTPKEDDLESEFTDDDLDGEAVSEVNETPNTNPNVQTQADELKSQVEANTKDENDFEEDQEVINVLQSQIEELQNQLEEQKAATEKSQQDYLQLYQESSTLKGELEQARNCLMSLESEVNRVEELTTELQTTKDNLKVVSEALAASKPFVDCFEGVDVSIDDLTLCLDLLNQLPDATAKQVVNHILNKDGINVEDKGKCLFTIKLVNSMFELGLLG